jgi:hypothetical protein
MVAEKLSIRIRDCIEEGETARLQRLLDVLIIYSRSIGPTDRDMIDNPLIQNTTFLRVLYEINNI